MAIVTQLPTGAPDDVYVILEKPQTSPPPLPQANAVAVVGTFNKGPVGVPTYVGDLRALVDIFGTSEDNLTGWIEAYVALNLGGGGIYVTRVTDGTDVAAEADVQATTGDGARFVAPTTGDAGNGAQVVVGAGTINGANNIQIVQGSKSESYPNVAFSNPVPAGATFGPSAMAGSQIAQGLLPVVAPPVAPPTNTTTTTGGTIGKVEIYCNMWWTTANGSTLPGAEFTVDLTASTTATNAVTFTPPTAPAQATGWGIGVGAATGQEFAAGTSASATGTITVTAIPTAGDVPASNTATYYADGALTAGTYTLANGTNGSNVTPAGYIGTSTGTGRTGVQSLAAMPTGAELAAFWLAGQGDATANGEASTWGASHNAVALPAIAAGVAPSGVATVATALGTAGAPAWTAPAYNWQTVTDPYTGTQRQVSPAAFLGGLLAGLMPWQSPANRPVTGSLGGQYAISKSDDAPVLQAADVNGIGPIAAGGQGFMSGVLLSGDDISLALMQAFVGTQTESALGWAVDRLITASYETQVAESLKMRWDALQKAGAIAAYSVTCDSTNNTDQTMADNQAIVDQVISLNYRARKIVARTLVGQGTIQTTSQTA